MSLRVRALLATGVLALSAGLTSTSVAYEPDQQQEGIVQAGPPSNDLSSPGVVDPGNDDVGATEHTILTDVLDSDPTADGIAGDPDADSGPVEPDPPDDTTDPDPSADPTAPPPAPVQSDDPPPGTPGLSQAPPLPVHRFQLIARGAVLQGRLPEPKAHSEARTRTREQAPTPAAATAAGPATAPSTPATTPLHGSTYTVQPGDSLWSIAARLLGANAAAATIAREVHRLWTLNKELIGTGDPNLLVAGITLRLR